MLRVLNQALSARPKQRQLLTKVIARQRVNAYKRRATCDYRAL